MDIIICFRDFTLSEYSYVAIPIGQILSTTAVPQPCVLAMSLGWEYNLHMGIWLFSSALLQGSGWEMRALKLFAWQITYA